MNILTNWKNVIAKFKSYDRETLESMKTGIIFAIIADLFAVYYYFNLKTLGGALLIFLMVFLVIILLLDRGLPEPKNKPFKKKEDNHNTINKEDKKMEETGTENQETIESPEEQGSNQFGLDLGEGFPSSEEISKGLDEFSGLGSF